MFHDFDPYESLQELQKQVMILAQKNDTQERLLQQLIQAVNNQSNLLNQHTNIINDLNVRLNSLERFDQITEVKLPQEYSNK
jgi:phage I-like protein